MLVTGHAIRQTCLISQLKSLPWDLGVNISSVRNFLQLFLRHHLAGKSVMMLKNVSFLRLRGTPIFYEPIYLESRPFFGQYQAKKNQNPQHVVTAVCLKSHEQKLFYTTHVLDSLLPIPYKVHFKFQNCIG